MRVLLITPENRFIKAFRRGQFNNFAQLTMPYLAGFVRWPHQVALLDEYNQAVDLDTPADLVGITCNTPNASEELQRAGRLLTSDWSYYNGKTAVAFRPARMSAEQLWDGYMWFRRRFFAPKCIVERVRRSRVRRLQSIVLNLGYWRSLANRIPGKPVPSALQGAEVKDPRAPTAGRTHASLK